MMTASILDFLGCAISNIVTKNVFFSFQPYFGLRGTVITFAVCPSYPSLQSCLSVISHLVLASTPHDYCFIFYGHILWNLSTAGLFWPLTVTLWPVPLKCCLDHCSETVNDNCFIFSRHINLMWDMCTVETFWLFDLCAWNYDRWLWNAFVQFLSRPVLYTISYFPSRPI